MVNSEKAGVIQAPAHHKKKKDIGGNGMKKKSSKKRISTLAHQDQNTEKNMQEPEVEENVPTVGTETPEQGEGPEAADMAEGESAPLEEDSAYVQEDEEEEQEQAVVIRSRRTRRNARFCAGIAAACLVTLAVFWGVTQRASVKDHSDSEEAVYQEAELREQDQDDTPVLTADSAEPEKQEAQTAGTDLENAIFPADEKETDTASSGSRNDSADENSSQSTDKNEGTTGSQATAASSADDSAAGNSVARPSDAGTASIVPTETPKPSHAHNWVQQYKTVHHDAVTQQVWIVDQAAWDEPVYEERPVYETYGVDICNVCGADCTGNIGGHGETHIDWDTMENPFSYHYEERQRQVGTETVQVGTTHHEEVGHWETQTVTAAYDEQVPDGYVCSGCGVTK